MTAKYNVVLKDPAEAIATRLNHATGAFATRVNDATDTVATSISHATERLATRCLEMLAPPAVAEKPAQTWAHAHPEAEVWPGWGRRMVPSLVITAWFGLVFLILALTAPPPPAKRAPSRPTASAGVRPAVLQPPTMADNSAVAER